MRTKQQKTIGALNIKNPSFCLQNKSFYVNIAFAIKYLRAEMAELA